MLIMVGGKGERRGAEWGEDVPVSHSRHLWRHGISRSGRTCSCGESGSEWFAGNFFIKYTAADANGEKNVAQ